MELDARDMPPMLYDVRIGCRLPCNERMELSKGRWLGGGRIDVPDAGLPGVALPDASGGLEANAPLA
eukprot:CAMPEP_0171133156 /NCGR_PEP_ID=MMETSP0766_2-20121228/125812_1 /TAXON_ID=439317 /ORGANISM="Gambierdiscus australes, Strain CAWD 149" /LENGTH=66 /DNA_ID=CAMNT_0011596525 /DNA_START=126 /DNA_END=326 /DNA_ORIENTATION=+